MPPQDRLSKLKGELNIILFSRAEDGSSSLPSHLWSELHMLSMGQRLLTVVLHSCKFRNKANKINHDITSSVVRLFK